MAMSKGSVSIDASGVATGSGATKALYDVYIAKLASLIPAGAAGAPAKVQIADLCDTVATLVDYIKTNGEVTVVVNATDAGLQRVGGVDTLAPATDKTLGTKGSIG